MPIIDQDFFLEHLDEIKEIFDKMGVKKAAIHFAGLDTILFMEFEKNASEMHVKTKTALTLLAHRYNVPYTLKMSGFTVFGQEIPLPEGSIEFEDLLKTKENENFDQQKDSVKLASKLQHTFFSNIVCQSDNSTKELVNDSALIEHEHDEIIALYEQMTEYLDLVKKIQTKVQELSTHSDLLNKVPNQHLKHWIDDATSKVMKLSRSSEDIEKELREAKELTIINQSHSSSP